MEKIIYITTTKTNITIGTNNNIFQVFPFENFSKNKELIKIFMETIKEYEAKGYKIKFI